eukprot:COSAG03_NODE_1618_length_3766_cov_3.309517_3_plen_72_part_00
MGLEECAPGARHVPPSEMMLPSSSVLKRLSCVCVCVCVCVCDSADNGSRTGTHPYGGGSRREGESAPARFC